MFSDLVFGAVGNFQTGDFLFYIVSFVILMLIIKHYAWGPVTKMMSDRAEKIANDLDSAEDSRKKANVLATERQSQLDNSRQEASEIVNRAKDNGKKQHDDIVTGAQDEATTLKQNAIKDIEQERQEALSGVQSDVAELSIEIASKIIQKELNENDQKDLINSYIEGLVSKMKLDKATVANRYGEAIFEIAEEQGNIVAFSEELEELRQVFLANPQLSDVLVGAQLNLIEKQGLIKVLLKDASPIIANVIQMVFDYGRMGDMVGIIEEFERLCDVKEKVVHATVTTAIKLDDDQLEKLSAKFAERIGANKIVFNNIIDEKIIGGVVIEANNQIFDGSISSKINKVKRLLANQ